MRPKLTNEIIDYRLLCNKRNIKRIGNYIDNKTPILFQCLVENCKYQWMARPYNILNKRGCPQCVGLVRLTDQIIDERLKNTTIKRIGKYINCKTPIDFQCLIECCKYIWMACSNNILNNNTGCPKCAGNAKLNNKEIDIRLIGRSIIRLDDYNGIMNPIHFQCLIDNCKYIWLTAPDVVLNQKSGCPACYGHIKLTNEIIDERLKLENRHIERLGNYINGITTIKWLCKNEWCKYIWLATPGNILRGKGCPKCSKGKNEKIVNYILKDYNILYDTQKDIRKIGDNEKRKIFVDFFIPSENIIIEYNGDQHYRPVCFGGIDKERAEQNFIKQQERDQYLEQFCAINGINLIWIDGRKYTNSKLKLYIIENIIPQLKKVG
jgi:hypothetical protein